MVIDLLVRFAVGSTQSGFNGPHGELQVHSQIPPSHGVAEYNYFPSPAQNSFNQGQFQPQHQSTQFLVSFSRFHGSLSLQFLFLSTILVSLL
ncbi:hypothetical protein ACOSQ3_013496 [Xanthoceras sorbifolium]